MRLMLLGAPRRPLRVADVPRPEPETGEVLITVQACGVCRTDLHICNGHEAFASASSFLRASTTLCATSGGTSWYTWNFCR
jgi:D-arabinose 1-dehydrogenase-like Zn-dependent alcohol dehydrogenase